MTPVENKKKKILFKILLHLEKQKKQNLNLPKFRKRFSYAYNKHTLVDTGSQPLYAAYKIKPIIAVRKSEKDIPK